jgi:hypothetical protein
MDEQVKPQEQSAPADHVTKTAFWATMIPLIAAQLLIPLTKEYFDFRRDQLASEERIAQRKILDEVKEGQTETHQRISEAVDKQREIEHKVEAALPPTLPRPE